VGYATAAAEIVAPESFGDVWEVPLSLRVLAAIARVRQAIGRRVVEALPGQTGAIANALITGERGGIAESTNQAFRNSGLFHILSLSGLHMVIMAGAAFFSIRLALAAVPAIALRYPIKKWAAAGAMIGAFGYLMISGAAFATVRSYIMISIMFLAVMLDRPAMALRNVALAALGS
jgi:competence protein ComEC